MIKDEIQNAVEKIKATVEDFVLSYKDEPITGTYDNWNAKDTAAHILEWIVFSKNKLQAIADKKAFKDVENIDEFNQANYRKNYSADIQSIKVQLLSALDTYTQVLSLYSQDDLLRKDLPLGFSFELWRYMIMDIAVHPVLHFLSYAVKTENAELFVRMAEEYKDIFLHYAANDTSVYSFNEYTENKKDIIKNLKAIKKTYPKNEIVDIVLKANILA